jgi:hypothetical protein
VEGAKPLSDVPMGGLRVSEEEQDLDWALKSNLISPSEYTELLEKTGLVPSELEFL